MDAVIDRMSGEMRHTLANLEPVAFHHSDSNDSFAVDQFSTSLPELIARMKEMVAVMEENTKIYESLKTSGSPLSRTESGSSDDDDDDRLDTRKSLWLNDAGRFSTYMPSLRGTSGSGGGDLRDTSLSSSSSHHGVEPESWRKSAFSNSMRSTDSTSHGEFPGTERQSFNFSESFKKTPSSRRNKPPPSSRLRLDLAAMAKDKPIQSRRIDYSVKWTHGDLGISLNNFTKDRRGFQISSLEQSAQCFTTGISSARLGDLLVFINHHDVEVLPCDQIKDILLSTPRPMTLGFRSNPSTVTSPTSAKQFQVNQRVFEEGKEDKAASHLVLPDAPIAKLEADDGRPTDSTVASDTSAYNEEIEDWLRRQDEMHSDLVLLLTETIHRCESVKEDNFDQLQHMMERAMRRRASSAAPLMRTPSTVSDA
ncbi:Aste57867_11165 [Aphanomyces stellatus]|uniref:Aste57867_11165 protein n=1 Tax=Aphanomyces stellatus TaxID=120398 RepID=A0A485KSV8_9STRA|nr:hypothetical protein As57867_011123 [Aphanomyces stellatus]VFT88032.1 Aste57867_11165 [Aphanomyces stellatus]